MIRLKRQLGQKPQICGRSRNQECLSRSLAYGGFAMDDKCQWI